LPRLFDAYQRGFDEGLDNDGFRAALLELAGLHPYETKAALEVLKASSNAIHIRYADWLLQFC
jgi:hypothetical protein